MLRHSVLSVLLFAALIFTGCTGGSENALQPRDASPLAPSYMSPLSVAQSFTIQCPDRAITGRARSPQCTFYDPGISSGRFIIAGGANCGVFDLVSTQTSSARTGVFKVVGYSAGSCSVALTDSRNSTAAGTIGFSGTTILGPMTVRCATNAASDIAACRYLNPLYTGTYSVESESPNCSPTQAADGSFTVRYAPLHPCTVSLNALVTGQEVRFILPFKALFVANLNDGASFITAYAFPYTGKPFVKIKTGGFPYALTFDSSNRLFVGSGSAENVTELVSPYTGSPIATFASGHIVGGLAINTGNDLFISILSSAQVWESAPPYTGAPIVKIPSVGGAFDLALDAKGDLFAPDMFNGGAKEIAPPYSGAPIATITTGMLAAPWGVAVSSTNDLFIANNADNSVAEYVPPYTGAPILTVTKGVSKPMGVLVDKYGELWVANFGNNTVTEYVPPYTGAPFFTISSGLLAPSDVAFPR